MAKGTWSLENGWGEPHYLVDDNGVPRRLHTRADTVALILVAAVVALALVLVVQDCNERVRREVCSTLLETGAEQRILDRWCRP